LAWMTWEGDVHESRNSINAAIGC